MLNDFIEYWTAAKLLITGDNPYHPATLLRHQQALGWTQAEPLMMWNPPWTLSFIAPFGYFDYGTAQLIWFIANALVIFVGAHWLWEFFGGDQRKCRYSLLSVLFFAPVYFVLLIGQIGPIILLGLMAFLYFARKEAWLLAGASLTLASVKPHLLYLFWLALAIWVIHHCCWRLLLGALVGGIVAAMMPLIWNSGVYVQYVDLIASGDGTRPLDWATPTLGAALGEALKSRALWVRWLPCGIGVLWFLGYWRQRAHSWNWRNESPLMLLVSLTTASFAWTFDHVVLLPAVVQCAARLSADNGFRRYRWVVLLFVSLGGLILLSKVFIRNDFW